MSSDPATDGRLLADAVALANARDFRGLGALLAPAGQALPDPDRLYRGLGLDDGHLARFLGNLGDGKGVPARHAYSVGTLAARALKESLLASGIEGVASLFRSPTTPEVATALGDLETALATATRLLASEAELRRASEPDLEQRLFERCARSYVLGELEPWLQSAARGGADGTGAGAALFVALRRGLEDSKHAVVVEFDGPTSGVVEVGTWPDGIREVVVLGHIPASAIRALWIDGQRFNAQELAVPATSAASEVLGAGRKPATANTEACG